MLTDDGRTKVRRRTKSLVYYYLNHEPSAQCVKQIRLRIRILAHEYVNIVHPYHHLVMCNVYNTIDQPYLI